MNRKHLSLLALILALVLACAPLSAMAESYSSTAFTLKNPSITIGDQTITAEVSLSLDFGVDSENGVGRLLLSLMGGDETALSGGASWDGESIIAGLDGMSKSVFFPIATLIDEVAVSNELADLEEPINDLMAAFAAFETYSPDEDTLNSMITAAAEALNLTYAEDCTFEYDENTTLQGICYDFSTTSSDIIALIENCRTIDPNLDTLFKDVEDAFNALVTAAHADVDYTVDDTMTIAGYVLITDNGDFVASYEMSETDVDDDDDDDDDESALCQLVVFNNESDTQINVYAEVPDDDGEKQYLIFDVVVPDEEGDVTISFYTDNIEESGTSEGDGCQIMLVTDTSMSYVTLTLYTFEDYYYENELYEDYSNLTATYVAGEAEYSDDGEVYPGTLVISYVENDEAIATISLETELSTYTSDQGYTASGDVIDLSGEVDDDTQEELYNELMTVVSNASAVIMSAPGVSDLLSLFGLN